MVKNHRCNTVFIYHIWFLLIVEWKSSVIHLKKLEQMRCICYVLCTKYHKQEYDCALLELMARNSPDERMFRI